MFIAIVYKQIICLAPSTALKRSAYIFYIICSSNSNQQALRQLTAQSKDVNEILIFVEKISTADATETSKIIFI